MIWSYGDEVRSTKASGWIIPNILSAKLKHEFLEQAAASRFRYDLP